MLELKRRDGGLIARTQHKTVQRQVQAHKADLRWTDLFGANLRGADLCRADLREADLRWADLSGAYLSGAYLSGADLCGANLTRAYLSGANLREADLTGAYLCGAYLCGADLCGANLYKANLYKANLYKAHLYKAHLCGANLCEASLSGSDLAVADLCGADLCGANLYKANLYKANLREADLTGAYLCGAYLCGAYLCGANLHGNPSAEWLSKWRGVNLLPSFDDGGVLVWKHVRLDKKRIIGNLDAEYAIGEPYEYASMVCAGPWGAVREVSDHRQAAYWAETARNPAPHLLAIHAAPGALYDYEPAKGVYYALRGTPVSLYRVTDVDADGFIPHLVAGEDVFGMIEGEEGVRDGTGDARH